MTRPASAKRASARVAVVGHVCLDVIPPFAGSSALEPGALIHVGPALRATGGAVANTGLALHRLGTPVTLMGKVGDDAFGEELLNILSRHDARLAEGMIVQPGEATSYSVVISPPGSDRTFLHCPGANDTFGPEDIDWDRLAGCRMLHFGYPPIMRRMRDDGGDGLHTILREAQSRAMLTSLDTCSIDPQSDAGNTDWRALLERVLPAVDLFVPSLDEILFMLGRPAAAPSPELLSEVAEELLGLGAPAVLLKLGDAGLYLRTSADVTPLASRLPGGNSAADAWTQQELYGPCFMANVAGTTGAGDCTIAGLLSAIARGATAKEALTAALAVGACSVEAPDAASGVRPWHEVEQRLAAGWSQHPPAAGFEGWPPSGHVRRGPHSA